MDADLYTCTLCGKDDYLSNYPSTTKLLHLMKEEKLCFHCAFWTDKIRHPEIPHEIIDGSYYFFGSYQKNLQTMSKIDQLNTKTVCVIHKDMSVAISDDVRFQGTIPRRFLKYFPDTAQIIPLRLYHRLQADHGSCYAKGCWDRYECFFYDMSKEPATPWNIIPKTHKTGDEYCPRFLNKERIPKWK